MVQVALFARARDLAGCDRLMVAVPEPVTVAALRRAIAVQCPALAALLGQSAIALNEEWAGDDQAIPPNARVAIIPPVSGG